MSAGLVCTGPGFHPQHCKSIKKHKANQTVLLIPAGHRCPLPALSRREMSGVKIVSTGNGQRMETAGKKSLFCFSLFSILLLSILYSVKLK
jgi:hypothetical protein